MPHGHILQVVLRPAGNQGLRAVQKKKTRAPLKRNSHNSFLTGVILRWLPLRGSGTGPVPRSPRTRPAVGMTAWCHWAARGGQRPRTQTGRGRFLWGRSCLAPTDTVCCFRNLFEWCLPGRQNAHKQKWAPVKIRLSLDEQCWGGLVCQVHDGKCRIQSLGTWPQIVAEPDWAR